MRVRIPIILSSANQTGNSAQLVSWLLETVNSEKYEFDLIQLYQLQIQSYTNENRKADYLIEQDRDAQELINKLSEAKQIIIATPIWNFSIPSVLKNLFDRALVSGRVWSEQRRKKVASWRGKRFYLLFTMGAPWYLAWPNYLGVAQVVFTLWYYGASCKIVKIVYRCGNGGKLVINNRLHIKKSLHRQGRKLFS